MEPGRQPAPSRSGKPASLAGASVGGAPIVKVRIPGGGPDRWKRFVADEAPAPTKSAPAPAQPAVGGAPPAPPGDAGGGPSDRIGAHYNDTHAVLGPRLFSTLHKDPALNPLLPGATPARRVLFYGSLYTTMPSGVMAIAKNAAADVRASAVAAKPPRGVRPAAVPSSEPPPGVDEAPDDAFARTAGGTAFATEGRIRAAGQAAREAVRAEVRAQLQRAEWDELDGGEVEALLKVRAAAPPPARPLDPLPSTLPARRTRTSCASTSRACLLTYLTTRRTRPPRPPSGSRCAAAAAA